MKLQFPLLLISALILMSCDQKATAPDLRLTNEPPRITHLSADISAVDPGYGVNLTCRAEDPDGDILGYYWYCSNATGSILNETINDSTSESKAQFQAGLQPTLATIFVRVSDHSLEVMDSLNIVIRLLPPTEVEAQVVSNTEVRLSWDYATGAADGFTVERSTFSTGPFEVICNLPGDSMGCTDEDLITFQTYNYRIAAYNEYGPSGYSEVAAVYLAVMPSAGLIAWYGLDGNALDASGFGRHGQVWGATPIMNRFGREARALNFNGPGSYVKLPNNLLSEDEVTLTAWINWSDNTLANQPIIKANGAAGSYLLFTPKSLPHYQLTLCDGVNAEKLKALPPLATNQWIFVAFMLANGNGTLFKNGVPVATGTISMTPAQVSGESFYLGGDPEGNEYLIGSLDDVRIYNRVLEMNEIELLYHEGGWGF